MLLIIYIFIVYILKKRLKWGLIHQFGGDEGYF